uniref:RxLR effector candidate protein n=1 Tax=Hyaloperonospora arabidopsidis (strain Emoy2) TaxID=559515 RepID=M4BMU1_HYAAE
MANETLNVDHQLGARRTSYRATADSRASEQDNSFAVPSRCDGSRFAPRESADHHASPTMALPAEIGCLQQRSHDLCDRTEQERQERLSLEAWVQRHLFRSDSRSEFALSQLEKERGRQAIREEVAKVRRHMATL